MRQEDREKQMGRRPGSAVLGEGGRSFTAEGGGGMKAALAVLQVQVKARDDEINACMKDISERDQIIAQCREEIQELKIRLAAISPPDGGAEGQQQPARPHASKGSKRPGKS